MCIHILHCLSVVVSDRHVYVVLREDGCMEFIQTCGFVCVCVCVCVFAACGVGHAESYSSGCVVSTCTAGFQVSSGKDACNGSVRARLRLQG